MTRDGRVVVYVRTGIHMKIANGWSTVLNGDRCRFTRADSVGIVRTNGAGYAVSDIGFIGADSIVALC